MSDWVIDDLKKWDDRICEIAKDKGLDWFPIDYEVCDYYEMIGHMSYHGLPSHYSHWSYGKSFERTHQMYNLGAEGLPYELIINSDPSIAYLMKENPLYLQILIMCHCVGHSDFFKNNRIFEKTNPKNIVARMRNSKKRIQSYIEDPHIGLEKVEEFLDSLHAIRFQTERSSIRRLSRDEILKKYISKMNRSKNKKGLIKVEDLEKRLLEPDRDLLGFLEDYGTHFKDWQLDLIRIVRKESQYFIPQIKTKIMNEGWASYWHYNLMKELDLPQKYHIPFLKSHNQVIRPHIGRINPYHLGFHMFQKIHERHGIEECFEARDIHDDEAFLRRYIQFEDMRELNLFSYSRKKDEITIDDVSDDKGWKIIRNDLLMNIGMNTIPYVIVSDITNNGDLILQHLHDGRDLDLEYAESVMNHIMKMWPGDVKFFTIIEDESWEI